jgi:hypothetical protein
LTVERKEIRCQTTNKTLRSEGSLQWTKTNSGKSPARAARPLEATSPTIGSAPPKLAAEVVSNQAAILITSSNVPSKPAKAVNRAEAAPATKPPDRGGEAVGILLMILSVLRKLAAKVEKPREAVVADSG